MTSQGVRPKTPPPGPPAPKPVPPPGAKMEDGRIIPASPEPVLMPDLPPFPFITQGAIESCIKPMIENTDKALNSQVIEAWARTLATLEREQERVTRIWEAFGKNP